MDVEVAVEVVEEDLGRRAGGREVAVGEEAGGEVVEAGDEGLDGERHGGVGDERVVLGGDAERGAGEVRAAADGDAGLGLLLCSYNKIWIKIQMVYSLLND